MRQFYEDRQANQDLRVKMAGMDEMGIMGKRATEVRWVNLAR